MHPRRARTCLVSPSTEDLASSLFAEGSCIEELVDPSCRSGRGKHVGAPAHRHTRSLPKDRCRHLPLAGRPACRERIEESVLIVFSRVHLFAFTTHDAIRQELSRRQALFQGFSADLFCFTIVSTPSPHQDNPFSSRACRALRSFRNTST